MKYSSFIKRRWDLAGDSHAAGSYSRISPPRSCDVVIHTYKASEA